MKDNIQEDLVSIIMPAYNSERYIEKTIESVIEQSYENWELIIVDDCSSDKTVDIVKLYIKKDDRIKIYELNENSGAAVARNLAIRKAEGKYLAFLDSDDLWKAEKLLKQISFMKKNDYLFTSTNFLEVNVQDSNQKKITLSYPRLDYKGVLKHCPGNSTVMYDAEKLGKFYSPDIKRRNDFAMWLQVIKEAEYLYGLDETLTVYCVREGSLSNNKKNLIKYQWHVYREIEKLSILESSYLLFHKIFSVLRKRL